MEGERPTLLFDGALPTGTLAFRLVMPLFVQRRGQPAEEFSLGHCAFGPIEHPKRNYPVEVTVALGRDGLVRINARDLVTGKEMAHTLEEGGGSLGGQELEEQRRLVESVQINLCMGLGGGTKSALL